jgi:hypothetical protein
MRGRGRGRAGEPRSARLGFAVGARTGGEKRHGCGESREKTRVEMGRRSAVAEAVGDGRSRGWRWQRRRSTGVTEEFKAACVWDERERRSGWGLNTHNLNTSRGYVQI